MDREETGDAPGATVSRGVRRTARWVVYKGIRSRSFTGSMTQAILQMKQSKDSILDVFPPLWWGIMGYPRTSGGRIYNPNPSEPVRVFLQGSIPNTTCSDCALSRVHLTPLGAEEVDHREMEPRRREAPEKSIEKSVDRKVCGPSWSKMARSCRL